MTGGITFEGFDYWLAENHVETGFELFLGKVLECVVEQFLVHLARFDPYPWKEIQSPDITEVVSLDSELREIFRDFEERSSQCFSDSEKHRFWLGDILGKMISPKNPMTEDAFCKLNLYLHDVLRRFVCALRYRCISVSDVRPDVVRILGERLGNFAYEEGIKVMEEVYGQV